MQHVFKCLLFLVGRRMERKCSSYTMATESKALKIITTKSLPLLYYSIQLYKHVLEGLVLERKWHKGPCPNFFQIRSEKNRSICWLWTTHSGLKTRMTCSKPSYGTIFFGTNLDEILDMIPNRGIILYKIALNQDLLSKNKKLSIILRM